jgi:TPP-dependent pyruvate/acetoin dehydrogenase alpha subunit
VSSSEPNENPLIKNSRLRQMYTAMLEAQELDLRLASSANGKRRRSTRGQEAVRVATSAELGREDLISDAFPTATTELLTGADPAELLRRAKRGLGIEVVLSDRPRILPHVEAAEARLQLALGAAGALKAQGRNGVVIAYAVQGELSTQSWRRILPVAAKGDFPILFVVLPSSKRARRPADKTTPVSLGIRGVGLPGIPVDAADAVALYRVTQESLGRARAGGGPVLIECVSFGQDKGAGGALEQLQRFMESRKVVEDKWFTEMTRSAQKRFVKSRS